MVQGFAVIKNTGPRRKKRLLRHVQRPSGTSAEGAAQDSDQPDRGKHTHQTVSLSSFPIFGFIIHKNHLFVFFACFSDCFPQRKRQVAMCHWCHSLLFNSFRMSGLQIHLFTHHFYHQQIGRPVVPYSNHSNQALVRRRAFAALQLVSGGETTALITVCNLNT